jgi:hypothetical protein
MNWIVKKKVKFYKFISKRKIIALMHNSIPRRIWLNFMEPCLVFIGSFTVFTFFFRISNFFYLSITEEPWLVEIHIWCIKIGIVLVLHLTLQFNCIWWAQVFHVNTWSIIKISIWGKSTNQNKICRGIK